VSACWGHGAVHGRAWYGAGECTRAWEHEAQSGRAGRLGCVGVARAHVDELDGEVTGLEVVGGVLPKHDIHGGQWRRPGRRGVAGSVSAGGVELGGQQGGARPLGVYGSGVDQRTEGEGGVLAGWPRVTPLSSMPSR
jgi:hypothetical protein